MKDIRKILFATDFSETSQKALDTTLYLKKELGCEVHVIHVFDPSVFEMPAPYYFMPGVENWLDEHLTGMKDKGRNALNDLMPGLGADCHGHFIQGKPTQAIVKFAEENGIDLIVMGSHGHSGVNHLLMGSVSEHVARHAPCAVLTIKPDKQK